MKLGPQRDNITKSKLSMPKNTKSIIIKTASTKDNPLDLPQATFLPSIPTTHILSNEL